MKNKLTTLDIVTLVHELRQKLVGLRVDQVYDVDRKTYLIRLTKTDVKKMLLIESASRFHTTNFEWPKNPAPSGFTMKLRKHLKNKRVETIEQVGADRIVHFQFGVGDFAFHLFLELYDKGNIILTDLEFNILTLVRPHVQGEDRFAAHEKYVTDKAKIKFSLERLEILPFMAENPGKSLRDIFLSKIEFGPALFAHVLKIQGLTLQTKLPADEEARTEMEEKLFAALELGRNILESSEIKEGGFITYTSSFTSTFDKIKTDKSEKEKVLLYDQFNPIVLVSNFDENNLIKFPSLDDAVDDFYSKIESQKLDLKQVTQEREAFKKLDRVKEDQVKRLAELKNVQETDRRKAELIMFNQELIEQTIAVIRQMIANQIPWDEIWVQIKDAQDKGDALAKRIVRLELLKTQITISLSDPYVPTEDSLVEVDIDLDQSAYSNASKYFDLKKASAKKEERTLQSQEKAFKSTEKRTMHTLREVAMIQQIKKARKVFWFEKFHWFISSENYLILGGHDAQQNELLVKRYMGPKDVYLHADSHGAPTFIIKNDIAPEMVSPKTLNETCCLAVSYSGSWESKIVASAWWVWGDQVSKSAPTGEYLPTGSFMIRGKKNYLPPCQLVLGFGFLFRISEESIPRHHNERARKTLEDGREEPGELKQAENTAATAASDTEQELSLPAEEEVEVNASSHSEDENEDSDHSPFAFPDTRLSIGLGVEDANVNVSRTRTISTFSIASSQSQAQEQEDSLEADNAFIINSGALKNFDATVQKNKKGNKKKEQKRGGDRRKPEPNQETETKSGESTSSKSKRGQHGRQKKIKEKYKDQDDEERELRMKLLQSAGKSKLQQTPPAVIREDAEPVVQKPKNQSKSSNIGQRSKIPSDMGPGPNDSDKHEVELQELASSDSHLGLLNSLTGSPLEEDELMFAIPVVAPYSTLQNYKFRIKILPGSNKRGKAARTALDLFLKDKLIRQREKDLLKSVKDQDLAKNFPGKVKLAAGADKR